MSKVDLELLKKIRDLQIQINELDYYIRTKSGIMYCYECGETTPEEGFYPIGFPQGFLCNPCAGQRGEG